MNVGELHGSVIHALDRPQSRIQGFGGMAEKKFDMKDFKRTASNEQRTIRLARRFDVDQELSEYIADLPLLTRPTGELISGILPQVRSPFPTMWVEFSAPKTDVDVECDLFPDEHNRVVGCLVEDANTHLEFQFFTEGRYHWWGVQYHRDRESHWPGELLKNNETEHYPIMSSVIARRCYGMDHVHESLESIVRHTNPVLKSMYAPNASVQGTSTMEDFFFGRMTLFVCMLIQTLNYPWVSYEPVMVVTGKKSKMPSLRPHDSYYRAKIVLPKEQHEMREVTPIGDPQHAKRLHQVRGHWRVYRNKDGSFRKRVWVAQHTRGNVKLGVVLKDYQLTFEKDEK